MSLDDVGLAQSFSADLYHRYAWLRSLGWLQRVGGVFEPMSDAAMQTVTAGLCSRAFEEFERGERGGNPSDAKKLRTKVKVDAIASLLRGLLEERDEAFDSQPELLCAPNGVVNLRTGALRDHDPRDRFFKQTRALYDPAATSPAWTAALEALPPSTRTWMQLRLGQAITGRPAPDHRVVLLKGGGENGKSLLLDAVLSAVGDVGGVVPHRLLLANPGDHPTEVMTLRGLRLAVLEELPEGKHLDVQRLKATTGTERITARQMRRDPVTFTASHSLFVTTNYVPRVSETDHGTWRRLAMVEFPFKFVSTPIAENERPRDEGLKAALAAGHPAVLAWLVQGAVRAYADDGTFRAMPETVERVSAEFRQDNDTLAQFAQDELVFEDGAFTSGAFLLEQLNRWLRENGYAPIGAATMKQRISDSMPGITYVKPKGAVRGYRGVRLRTSMQDQSAA